jgi:hypothetical protein
VRLYIWEGGGISDAYHDDGTLVVLAESPEQARDLARDARDKHDAMEEEYVASKSHRSDLYDAMEALMHYDGTEEALAREPDRIVELDTPRVVAFNGGGYD